MALQQSVDPARRARDINRILNSLPDGVFDKLRKDFELVPLKFKQVVHEPGGETPYIYFPISGVLSLLTNFENGTSVELATVGNEGMADISVFLGIEASETQITAQIPGQALRMKSDTFRRRLEEEPYLRKAVGAYILELFTMVAQNNACNRAHKIPQRLARWLLMCHDRVDADDFPITQEFMSEMLGVRRPSVTTAAGELHEAGAIDYRRGQMHITDRRKLEESTCECYQLIRERFDRLPGKVKGQNGKAHNGAKREAASR